MQSDICYRRLPMSGLDFEAEIGTRPDLRPVRLTTNGRRHRAVGAYFSIKSGRLLHWESRNELHDMWRAEVSFDVVKSWEQPHTLKMVRYGQHRRYTPDRLDLLSSGKNRVIEVKDNFEAEKDAAYAEKLDLAAKVYQTLGWDFHVFEKPEIEAEPTFSAIDKIQSYRCADVRPADILKIRQLLSNSPSLAVEAVTSFLGGGPPGFAMLCALIVRRIIRADITHGLNELTPLYLVQW